MWFFSRLFSVLLVSLLFLHVVSAESENRKRFDEAWELAARTMFSESLAAFERIRDPSASEERELNLGRALVLLNQSPRTQGTIGRARQLLIELSDGKELDDFGIAAIYYLARLEQWHAFEPDLNRAKELFRYLVERFPDHPHGQEAAVKLAVLLIYTGDDEAVPPSERLASAEELRGTIVDTSALRRYHLAMAGGYNFYEIDSARRLEHLLAADEHGSPSFAARADLWVMIGEQARNLGRFDLALDFYRRFVDHHPRDDRAYMVTERTRELLAAMDEAAGGAVDETVVVKGDE